MTWLSTVVLVERGEIHIHLVRFVSSHCTRDEAVVRSDYTWPLRKALARHLGWDVLAEPDPESLV